MRSQQQSNVPLAELRAQLAQMVAHTPAERHAVCDEIRANLTGREHTDTALLLRDPEPGE